MHNKKVKIKDFSEKKIRNSILNKIDPRDINKTGDHWKGYIYLGKILITKVKIPNNHTKIMKESKSQYIANALKLNAQQFNNLIECPLRGPAYYEILENFK